MPGNGGRECANNFRRCEGPARTTLSASPEMTKESIDSAAENLNVREKERFRCLEK
jgi:hypothetical protein